MQRRQAWRGSDPEMDSNAQASDQTGDEVNNTSSEHHEDIPDEEVGSMLFFMLLQVYQLDCKILSHLKLTLLL